MIHQDFKFNCIRYVKHIEERVEGIIIDHCGKDYITEGLTKFDRPKIIIKTFNYILINDTYEGILNGKGGFSPSIVNTSLIVKNTFGVALPSGDILTQIRDFRGSKYIICIFLNANLILFSNHSKAHRFCLNNKLTGLTHEKSNSRGSSDY